MPNPITLTDNAARQVKAILAKREKPAIGLRIGIKSKGCSGLSYAVDYAEERKASDLVIEDKGVCILLDPKAQMFLVGTELDWIEDKLQSGFVFHNPNEKGRCGCGESFHI